MVMGASSVGWVSPSTEGGTADEAAVSVVASMDLLRVGFLRLRQRRSKPGEYPGTHDRLDRRVVLKKVRFLPHFQHPGSEKPRSGPVSRGLRRRNRRTKGCTTPPGSNRRSDNVSH